MVPWLNATSIVLLSSTVQNVPASIPNSWEDRWVVDITSQIIRGRWACAVYIALHNSSITSHFYYQSLCQTCGIIWCRLHTTGAKWYITILTTTPTSPYPPPNKVQKIISHCNTLMQKFTTKLIKLVGIHGVQLLKTLALNGLVIHQMSRRLLNIPKNHHLTRVEHHYCFLYLSLMFVCIGFLGRNATPTSSPPHMGKNASMDGMGQRTYFGTEQLHDYSTHRSAFVGRETEWMFQEDDFPKQQGKDHHSEMLTFSLSIDAALPSEYLSHFLFYFRCRPFFVLVIIDMNKLWIF